MTATCDDCGRHTPDIVNGLCRRARYWHAITAGDDYTTTTGFLAAVAGGATRDGWRTLTRPAVAWWASTRACLERPPAAVPCGYTRDDGIRWRCGRQAHDGDNHWDPAYGWIPATAPSAYLGDGST